MLARKVLHSHHTRLFFFSDDSFCFPDTICSLLFCSRAFAINVYRLFCLFALWSCFSFKIEKKKNRKKQLCSSHFSFSFFFFSPSSFFFLFFFFFFTQQKFFFFLICFLYFTQHKLFLIFPLFRFIIFAFFFPGKVHF